MSPNRASSTQRPSRSPDDRGRHAQRVSEIPARGFKDVLLRTKNEVSTDRISLVAAAVAFYALLAVFPALIAVVSVYGLFSDPVEVERQLTSLGTLLPKDVLGLIGDYLHGAAGRSEEHLGWGTAIGIIGALWSASGGVVALMQAINIAYDEDDKRGFFRSRGLALGLTLGATVFVLASIVLIAVLPNWLDALGLGPWGATLLAVLRWPALAAGALVGLAVLYRVAPDRNPPRWRWVTWGSAAATVLWLGASVLFSYYATNFGSFGTTYGPIAGVIVLMLWLYVSAFAVLLGAELNSELEAQTAEDSTVGPPRPMGQRQATKADVLGEPLGSH